jgi:hypothetical protein
MPKPATVTPEGRIEQWKRKWSHPQLLNDSLSTQVFETFLDAFVPSHMVKQFVKTFGVPKAAYGNRFFPENSSFVPLSVRIGSLLGPTTVPLEADLMYALADDIEVYRIRSDTKRTFKDLFIDDWHAACATFRCEFGTGHAFIEPKMRGAIVQWLGHTPDEEGSHSSPQ